MQKIQTNSPKHHNKNTNNKLTPYSQTHIKKYAKIPINIHYQNQPTQKAIKRRKSISKQYQNNYKHSSPNNKTKNSPHKINLKRARPTGLAQKESNNKHDNTKIFPKNKIKNPKANNTTPREKQNPKAIKNTNNKIYTSHILERYAINQIPIRARPTGLALIQILKKRSRIINQHKHKTTYTHQILKTNINQLTHTTNIDPKNINKQWYKTCEVEKPHYITQTRHHTITTKDPHPKPIPPHNNKQKNNNKHPTQKHKRKLSRQPTHTHSNIL